MRRGNRTPGQGRLPPTGHQARRGAATLLQHWRRGARAEATPPTQGTSLAPTGARQERRGGGGGGKVSWGKALKGPERGVTLWQSREGA